MAIGVCFCHKIIDAASLATLMNGWASISRGETISNPDFQSSKLFPTEGPVAFVGPNMKENIVTKRLLFDASMIATLRVRPANHLENHPTRVEAVTVLIWRCMMRACGAKEGLSKTSMEVHAVNLRGRMVPPVPEYSFGNLLVLATSVAMEEECHIDTQHYLERKIRDATREIDIDYIKQLQKTDGVSRVDELIDEKIKKYSNWGRDLYAFSSWCRFPFYDADFGWGRPTWVCTSCWGAKNSTILMDTRDGDGIEAWVNMEDVDMAIFEQDQELLSFVTPSSID
ncbi:stemmadenine O-acetyltransferase-like [Magnolia sinica]|uniref:stemmadenine O-acetyltransferase-like n=1 Tax=Magnolia sinica TaxID=86752 RepID=UPI00265A2972|nr:stemmadenine O-acetyltransferase-like [Magnolia sinica]